MRKILFVLMGRATLLLTLSAVVLPGLARAAEPIPTCGATDRHFDPNEVPAVPVGTGSVYFVDAATGSDSNDGLSEAKAFKTIGRAVNDSAAVITPGSTVRIKAGFYRERLNITKSGTASSRIAVGAYGNGEVIIDGSTAVTGWTQYSGQIYKATPGFAVTAVVVDEQPLFPEFSLGAMVQGRFFYDSASGNLYVWGPAGGNPASHDVGVIRDYEYENTIYLNPSSYLTLYGLTVRFSGGNAINLWGDHVRVEKCRIKFAGKTGVSIFPYSTIASVDAEIIKNEIYNNFLRNWPRGRYKWGGWGMGATSNGTQAALFQGNVVHKNGGEGLGAYSGPGGTIFRDNVVYDNWSVNIYIDNQPNVIAENNFVYSHQPNPGDLYNNQDTTPSDNSNLKRLRPEGIVTADENYGHGANLNGVLISNNVIVNCRRGYNHFPDVTGSALKNVKIVGNTIIVAQAPVTGETVLSGMNLGYNGGADTGSIVENNIVYATNANTDLLHREDGPSSGDSFVGLTMSHNAWFHASRAKPFHWGPSYNPTYDYDHAPWAALTGAAHAAGDVATDPFLIDAVTIDDVLSKSPASDSPTIDAGMNAGVAVDYDFCPRPVGAAFDIGAYETSGVPVTPAFRIGDVSVTEPDSGTVNAVFTVTLSPVATGTATVHYATTDGTAVAGTDYTATSGDLTFAIGDTTKTLNVPVIGNTTVTGNRTFLVMLSAATGADISDDTAQGTIVENDVAQTLQFNAATYSVGEAGGSATITVRRTGASTGSVTVNYATSDGSATAGADYTAASGTLTFGAGVTSLTFAVPILQDSLVEGSETVNLTLSNPSAPAVLGAQATAVLTITDDDVAPSVQFSAASYTVSEAGGSATITVTRTLNTGGAVTVQYATSNGTATGGADYTATSGTLSFAAGVTSLTFGVPILQDTLVEGNETVNLALSVPGGGAILGAQKTAVLTIVDDDATVAPVTWTSMVGVSSSSNSLTKTGAAGWNAGAVSSQTLASGDGNVEITASETTSNRMFGLSHGDSDQTYPDIDFAIYLINGGSIQLYERGTLRGSFGTYATNDKLQVAVESGVVKYKKNGTVLYTSTVAPTYPLLVDTSLHTTGATINSAVVTGTWSGTVTPLPTLSINDVSVTEGNSGTVAATFTVTLSATSATPVTVNYATADGTATVAGSDYVAKSGTLTFAAGTTTQTIAVTVNGDTVVEPNETFVVNLSAPSGATIADAQGVGTIVNDDSTPPPSTTPVTWTSMVGVSSNSNNLTKTGAAGWNAGAVSSQTLASGDGNVEITASETTSNRMFGLSHGDSDQTYPDIDFAIYLINGGSIQLYERGTLRGSFGTYATNDKLQVAVESGVVKYKKNGTVLYTSTVAPTYPLLVDTSLHTTGATINSAVVTGTWSGTVTPLPTLSINDVSVTEGNSGTVAATFTVTLSATSATPVTVNYATADGTATVAGSDYVAKSGTLTFAAGTTTQTIAVTVNGDTVVEPNETFVVNLSAPSGATIADAQGVGTIVNDDSTPPPSTTPVTWTSMVGVSSNSNNLTKTGAAGWNAGAVSSQTLASGDGNVEITASETTSNRMFGLSHGDSDQTYPDIDFAMFLVNGGAIQLYERGTLRGSFGTYSTNDKLQVAVESGVVKYKKNGTVLYTSTVAPTYPLLVDTSLHTTGATINSAVVTGTWQ